QMLYMSPSAEITYGRLPAEFFNNPNLWSEVVHPDDRVGVDAFFEEIFEKAQANHEYRIVLPDGSVRWMLDRTWLVYDEQGDPIRVDGVSTDVSDSVLARQKISEQAALLDVSNDAIIVRGMDGQILFWNKGAEALYGWQAEEALGQNAEQLMYGDDTGVQETVQSEIFPTLAHQGTWRDERQSITKAGDRLTVISRWTSVKDPQGNPTSILIVNTDITEQKQMEEQFFRAQRLESLGILASGIAHDLNNIMTPILGVAQLLPMQLPDLSEQIREELNVLQVSARRGSEIIGQVLSFARGAEGDGEASSGKNRPLLNVKHLISEIKNFAGKTFPKSFDFTVDIPNDLWAVEGDATKLYQVFMNLFVNARDAMPKGGNLSVLATNLTVDSAFATHHLDAQPGPYIMVTIADTGKGIPLEVLDRIFEPFFTTKKSEGGTGLGLSTVHGIVRSHGGFVTVYSEVGRGSQFKVYLPAIASTAATPTEVPTASLAGHRELVLVVDDEEPILEITRSILEAHNYQVITAVDGIDAIANYTEHKASISIVLMDITMPNLDGATAIQIMQKINPELKVIVTSGLLSNQQHTSLIGNSVKTFLQKPYSPEGLLQSIQSVFQSEYEDRT
ncbi:MAG: PAS domain S-box protein, partial [Cyanobacteria bacterium J06649_4]